jgi:hypothetical protein
LAGYGKELQDVINNALRMAYIGRSSDMTGDELDGRCKKLEYGWI